MEAFLCLLRESVWLRDKKRGPFSSLLAGAESNMTRMVLSVPSSVLETTHTVANMGGAIPGRVQEEARWRKMNVNTCPRRIPEKSCPRILCWSCQEVLPEAAAAIRQAIILSSPGPHAVLLVTQLGRFTDEDQQVVRRLQEVFGVGVLGHTILVFTRKEDLAGGSLEDYVRETDNQALAQLDVTVARRHCSFNNRAQGEEQEAQLQELMENVKAILWENEGNYYSNKAYQYTQQNLSLKELQERKVTQDQGSEDVPGEESWMEGLSQIQKESEEAHRRLLGRADL
ncbi:GTPase IMAP family member 6 isoform X4 [Macaca thibetana thibetana]|uniref:GTPase IMAP family member 6 isoform X4 n=1 Tax=Macaca thibetana thibetana TaxID=257877 RepID=UPI0021BCD931|nr:GTPase IMAP family member 6 isoform X4 [Macaca thibetana thibetana]